MIFFQFVCLILSIFATLASSIGSESGSLSACSKFDFEEKVLEKLVRLEHKMEVYTEKMKLWEESVSTSLDKVVEAKIKTETFIESMRETQRQYQTRFNESLLETIEHFKLQSENKTEMYERKMNTLLESFSFKIQELSEAERKRESATQVSLDQEQNRFNASFDKIVENFQVRFNKSLQEIALNQQKANGFLLDKLQNGGTQNKNQYLTIDDKIKMHHDLEDLRTEQEKALNILATQLQLKLVNIEQKVAAQSSANDTCQRTIAELKQEYHEVENDNTKLTNVVRHLQNQVTELEDKYLKQTDEFQDIQLKIEELNATNSLMRNQVALTACHSSISTVSGGEVVHFSNIKTNVGITDLSAYKSTGKFVCTFTGLYFVSAVIMSNTNDGYYYLFKNNFGIINTYYGDVGSLYETRTRDFVTMLDVGDEITVRAGNSQNIYAHSCFTIVKIN